MDDKHTEQQAPLSMYQISTELSDAEQIFQAMQDHKLRDTNSENLYNQFSSQDLTRSLTEQTTSGTHSNFIAPRTPTEKQLAGIWTEFLGIQPIGIHDHFFDLGGDSVVALQIFSRVRDIFQVELSLDTLFTIEDTIAEFAKIIEEIQITQVDNEKVESLLQEVNELSDDEVKTMLAQREHLPEE